MTWQSHGKQTEHGHSTISIFSHPIFLGLQLSDQLKQLLLSRVKLTRAATTQFHGYSLSFSVTEATNYPLTLILMSQIKEETSFLMKRK